MVVVVVLVMEVVVDHIAFPKATHLFLLFLLLFLLSALSPPAMPPWENYLPGSLDGKLPSSNNTHPFNPFP